MVSWPLTCPQLTWPAPSTPRAPDPRAQNTSQPCDLDWRPPPLPGAWGGACGGGSLSVSSFLGCFVGNQSDHWGWGGAGGQGQGAGAPEAEEPSRFGGIRTGGGSCVSSQDLRS